MKKYLTTLLVTASAMFAQAADLENQLLGYWQPDPQKTAELAKRERREINPLEAALQAKIITEFQKDKMIAHAPKDLGLGNLDPVPYKIKKVDKATNTLMLAIEGGPDATAVIKGEQLALKSEEGWTIYNRLTKEAFAKSQQQNEAAAKEVSSAPAAPTNAAPPAPNMEDVTTKPIPATPAVGKINGVNFKVEEAIVQDGVLKLRGTVRGGENIAVFNKNWFTIEFAKSVQPLEEKSFIFKKGEPSADIKEISANYITELGKSGSSAFLTSDATMKLEYGKAKNGKLPGKIHLRITGQPESFVVGSFEAVMK